MVKYEVLELNKTDEKIGLKIGDTVYGNKSQNHKAIVTCRLPYRLYGKGHYGDRRCNPLNYWHFASFCLKRIKEV